MAYFRSAATAIAISMAFICNVHAGSQKAIEHMETGKCSDVVAGKSNETRMKQNNVNEAKAWCEGSGGAKLGGSPGDYTAATEGTGPFFCRVKGKVECNK